ncbi:lysine--tRNA ligase, partial [Candidatus Babeliales bacterium]|nr:lysine--tRNA ligase [Candidatus Babeliales bacterium]
GLVDTEQRYRQRYLDLISNPENKEKFKKRFKIIQALREFLLEKDFLEVETPMLHVIPGGANAKPFVTHHNAYDMDLYLRIAPELYLKRLVVGGFDRVFEINRNFRNEGVSTKHNPEFTMLEFYMAHGDYKDGMQFTEELIQKAVLENFDSTKIIYQGQELDFAAPFEKITMHDSLVTIAEFSKDQISVKNIDKLIKTQHVEINLNSSYGEKIYALFEKFVEPKIVQPTFIVGFPIEVSPLAKRDPKDTSIAARFELFVAGIELANGFTELNDPFDQAERFKQQVQSRTRGNDEAHYYDADYIKALEYGLPPTVGVGLGIDRLVMFLTDTSSIKDVILFPTMKPDVAENLRLRAASDDGQDGAAN